MNGSTDPSCKSSRDCDNGRTRRKEDSHLPQCTVLLSEIGTPMDNAVGFVNEHRHHVAHERGVAQDTVGELARLKHFRGYKDDLILRLQYVLRAGGKNAEQLSF